MAEITSLTTLAKTSTDANEYLLVANSSTKAAKKFQLQSLFPVVSTAGTASETLYTSAVLTNKNQIVFKGLKALDTTIAVTTTTNNITVGVNQANIDLDQCDNTTSGFITGINFAGTVTGQCAVANGGTGLAAIAKGALLYASATDTIAATSAMSTNGQLLIGNVSTGVPSVTTLTAGSNMTVTNGAGTITLAASLSSLAATLDTGAYNIDLNTNYISDDGSSRGLYIYTGGKAVINDSGSSLTGGDITGQLNLQGTGSTAITIGNSGAYQSSYTIQNTTSGSGTAGAGLDIRAGNSGGGNVAGGSFSLYAGAGSGSGKGGHLVLYGGDTGTGTEGSIKLYTYTGGVGTIALTADSNQDVTVNTGSLIIAGAAEGIVHTNSGTVTQATDHTTGVTLNTTSGVITLAAVALAATTNAEFTFTNSTIQADSVILLSMQDENSTNNAQLACAVHTIGAGSCIITLVNPHSSGATSAHSSKIHFLVINNSV
jgi:hypothetical protein